MYVKIQTCIAILLLFTCGLNLEARNVDEDFRYQLLVSDNLQWLNKKGLVVDQKLRMASALQDLILNAKSQIHMALYGVEKQSWFLTDVKKIRSKISLLAIVDQKAGKFNEWIPENFTYHDTPLFASILGFAKVHPDINSRLNISSTIMHNKFAIFDAEKVWLGSTNLSFTCLGSEYNSNVSLIVSSKSLASVYEDEFSQMYFEGKFSRSKDAFLYDHELVYRDGTRLSVYFAPQDKPTLNAVIPLIESAKSNLDIAMFFLTDKDIAEAIIDAKKRGVDIRVILDAVAARNKYSQHHRLRQAGVEVRVENWGGKMHMKAAVVDNSKTLIGSMNWSASGDQKNDENLVIVQNEKLASEFLINFEKYWTSLENLNFDPNPEGPDSINSCFDGIDNDHNGVKDEHDSKCKDVF